MFHVRVSPSLNLRFSVFTVLLSHTVVLLGLIHPCRGQNRVIGPSEPIVALVGEDIVLPSSLDPPVNAFGMTVEWTRTDLDPRFVLVWRDGGELENKKHPSYVGRTSVFSEELKHGNVSLKLSKVKISDGGTYRCFIPGFNIHYTVQLVVGQNRVIGPSEPIVALVGEDIVLPSSLDPPVNAFGMTVEWTRPDLDPRFVLVWRDGGELENKKHPSYVGRTSVFSEELKHGIVSLKLSKVKISDGGTYRCFIPDFNIHYTVQLVVGSVSSPVVHMTTNSSAVVLQCESEGWYPEPEALWLDGEGHVLSAGPTETVRGPDGLYTVSSRVTVEERHRNNFTCRVQQKDINQTRETQIHVPDHFFVVAPHTPGTPSAPGTPGGLPAILVCAVFVLTVVFLVWKIRRQKRLRNKRRGLEDGPEQTDKEKTVASKGDETSFHVMNEGEESEPLMATREEENNLDNTGQEEMKSQSEHEEVAERETNQDQLVINPEIKRDKDSAERGVEIKFINNEKAPLISAEGETHQRQDMIGRQVKSDLEKDEGEQTKPAKEDSGLSVVVVVKEQKEQLQNLHTDQEEEKEEETQQEQATHQRKAKEKKKKVKPNVYKQEKPKKVSKARQMKEQREQELLEEERQREENEKKLQSELQKRKEKDEMKLKSQEGDGGHHLLEDNEQERSEAEVRGKKEEDQKGNNNDCSGMTGRKVENQEEEMNEKVKETGDRTVENVGELQSERPEQIKRTVEGNGNQHVLDTSKQEAEDEGKKGRDREENQSDITTERDMKRNENEKLKETRQEKRDERENKPPAVSSEVTERLDLSIQETQQQEFQEETKHQAEKQQEETSVRNQGETKELLEQSIKGDDTDESQKMSKETGQKLGDGEVGQLQAVQQAGVKEEIREQPEGSSTCPAETRAESHEEKAVESNRRPTTGPTQRNVRRRTKQQHKQGNQLHVDQQREVKKKKHPEEEVQTPETFKKAEEEHLLEDNEQERSEAEVRGKREEDQKGNHNDCSGMTGRNVENQEEKMNEKLKETGDRTVENMGELQSERPEQIKRTEEGNGNQHVLDTSKQEAEVEDRQREVEERKHQEDDEVQTLETCESEEEQMECEEAEDTEQKVMDESEHMDWSAEVDQDEQMEF